MKDYVYFLLGILLINSVLVSSQPTKIDISVDAISIKPEGNITFRVMLYDQSNNLVQDDVSVKISDPIRNIFFEKLVRTGENIVFPIGVNFTVGYWSIEASSNNIYTKTLFFVEKKEEADFNIINDKLIVKNIGNVPYQKTLQISIGDNDELRQMNIDVGGFVEFRLLAPEGLYRVRVTDGDKTLAIDNVALTGNIVGVVGLSGRKNILAAYPLVWLFLVIVIGMFILILIERIFKRGMVVKTIARKHAESSFKPTTMKKKSDVVKLGRATEAEHAISLRGTRQEAALIAVNVKNINDVKNSLILDDIERTLKPVAENKGLVYKTGGYVIGIFTPQTTKTFKNADTAIKVAESILDGLMKYNQTHSFKTNVGIGVHTGEIIVDDKGKFTSLGNTLALAKKLADISNQEIALSKEVRAKIGSEYRIERKSEQGFNFYTLSRIYNRSEHDKFLQGFLKRNFE
ncbi:hypothetical protein HYV49_00465 [Candidatus Pacearchaeota archaeon]|nr:hypothetical protein [Candidatus Pacearchaeota archaeon]